MEISSDDLRNKYMKLKGDYSSKLLPQSQSQIGHQPPLPPQDIQYSPVEEHRSNNSSEMVNEQFSDTSSLVDTKSVEGIHVAVRIRPLSTREKENGYQPCCHGDVGDSSVCIVRSGDRTAYLRSQAENNVMQYKFDAVYDENATQIDVFEKSVRKYITKALKGENVTVFAYGATGAGKTHTMMGNTRVDSSAHGAAGIIPNAVREVFNLVAQEELTPAKGEKWMIHVGYMEVYNDQVYDLLNCNGKTLSLQEDPAKGTVTPAGLTEYSCRCYDDVLEILMQGNQARKTESTMANVVSSRSHAILQLTIKHVTRELDTGKELQVESKLSFIDLAGSERASATKNKGARLVEGGNINKSLLALGNVINALSQRAAQENNGLGNGVIQRTVSGSVSGRAARGGPSGFSGINAKYRDSKLTHLLKGSLEGNCNIVMIANINPSHGTYDDSYHTLSYAYRAKTLKVNPQVKAQYLEVSVQERERRQKEENQALRARISELEMQLQESLLQEQMLRDALRETLTALESNNQQNGARRRSSSSRRQSRKRSSWGSTSSIGLGDELDIPTSSPFTEHQQQSIQEARQLCDMGTSPLSINNGMVEGGVPKYRRLTGEVDANGKSPVARLDCSTGTENVPIRSNVRVDEPQNKVKLSSKNVESVLNSPTATVDELKQFILQLQKDLDSIRKNRASFPVMDSPSNCPYPLSTEMADDLSSKEISGKAKKAGKKGGFISRYLCGGGRKMKA